LIDPPETSPAAFVESKVTQSSCPFCGHDDWHYLPGLSAIIGVTSDLDAALLEDEPNPPPSYFPAVGLNCFNCGFVRFHVHPVAD
jgi:hypothetical protein